MDALNWHRESPSPLVVRYKLKVDPPTLSEIGRRRGMSLSTRS